MSDSIVIKQSPERLVQLSENTVLADFGKDAFGRLEIEFEAADAEYELRLAVGEVLRADGRLERVPGGARYFTEMTWRPRVGKQRCFLYIPAHRSPYQAVYQNSMANTPDIAGGEIAPFRYAEFSGRDVRSARLIRHAVFGTFDDSAAHFECSDTRLNQVWDFCKYSIKATSPFAYYVDGHRERQAFEGDCYINALGAYCTGGGYEKARKTITFLLDYYPMNCLEYRLFMPMLVRDYLNYSGETGMYKYWQSSLPERLCTDKLKADGLFHDTVDEVYPAEPKYPAYEYHFPRMWPLLVDWPQWEQDDYEKGDLNFIGNAFLHEALLAMHELEPAAGYGAWAEKLRAIIRKTFHRADGRFVDNAESSHMALHTAMFALTFGLADPEDVSALTGYIRSRGMACTVYGAQFLLDACFANGLGDYAIELLRSEGPRSWLNMMKQGSTVSMEAWSNECKPNQDWNHAWGAAPANVIPRRLCGVRPTAPGFARFEIDPQPGPLEFFRLRHPTVHGPVELEYDSGRGSVMVPPGTVGRLPDGRELAPGKHDFELSERCSTPAMH